MIRIDYLSVARLSGPDAGDFLQSQLSADIKALEPGQSTFAAYCTPRGQVLGLLLVCREDDQFLLIGSAELLPGIISRLRIFVMRSKVEWDDVSELQVFGVAQGDSQSKDYALFTPSSVPLVYAVGADLAGSSDQTAVWKSQELHNGVAWLDSLTTEKFIPQMLGQDNIGALSFSKGCYPGQEIVARTRYLGKVKRKPLVVTVTGPVQIPNASRLEMNYPADAISGTLIDSAKNKNGDTVLFVVTNLQDDHKPVSVTCDGKNLTIVSPG